jgi:uncharacterized membrane protein
VAEELTRVQRLSDKVTEFCGSWTFITAFSVLLIVWVVLNTIWLEFGEFDPYPFIFFNLILTVVSTFQGPLIMMSQNRQAERERARDREQAQRDRDAVQGLHEKLDKILGEGLTVCVSCGVNFADPPSELCVGCQAYEDHQK